MMGPTMRFVVVGALVASVSGCGAPPAPAPSAAPAPAPKPAAAPSAPNSAASAQANIPGPGAEAAAQAATQVLTPPAPKYNAKGRRDPFDNLEVQLKEKEKEGGFTIASTKLTGIVQGQTRLALIETVDGVGYILKPGDTLGDGRLVEIARDSAVFAVTPKPGSTSNRVILKIAVD